VYKNFDISGLFGMVGPLLRLARAAMVRRKLGKQVRTKWCKICKDLEKCVSNNVEHLGMS